MNGKPLLSVFALSLLVAAILLPWPIMAFGREEFALIFAGASIVLSLYFAWLARAEYLSQVVLKTVGGLVGLIVLIVVVSFPLFMWRSNVDRVEAMRQVAARNEEEQRLRSQIEYGERMLLDDRAELKKSLDQGAQRLEEQAQAEVVKQTAPPSGVSETVKPANLKGTLQKLQGRWKVTLWNQNNETAQADEPVEMRFLFEGDRLFQTARSPFAGEQSEAKIPWGRIEINQESQPAQVAIVNENQGTEKRIGLIEVIGDKLRMAFRTTETGISSSEFPKDILAGDNVIYIECTKAN